MSGNLWSVHVSYVSATAHLTVTVPTTWLCRYSKTQHKLCFFLMNGKILQSTEHLLGQLYSPTWVLWIFSCSWICKKEHGWTWNRHVYFLKHYTTSACHRRSYQGVCCPQIKHCRPYLFTQLLMSINFYVDICTLVFLNCWQDQKLIFNLILYYKIILVIGKICI